MGFNKRWTRLNQDCILLEADDSNIDCVYDGRFRVNKVFAVMLRLDGKSKECFFDLEGESAACDKIDMKPFKRRRI